MSDETTDEVFLNPFEEGFFDNPYRQYRRLREKAPVHQSPTGPWCLLGYEECARLIRDPSLSVEDRNATVSPRDILNMDPPDHTRIRRLFSKAFTPRRIEELVETTQSLVDTMLDGIEDRGRLDVIPDLAFPLPFAVISRMLGMPEDDSESVRDWSHTLVQVLEPMLAPEELAKVMIAGENLRGRVTEVIEEKRKKPADDLLSALIAVEEQGDRLSEEELLDQVMLLYIAGHETTVNLIGNGMLALLRNPEQLNKLAKTPQLIDNGIDELLRFDSPVQFTRRVALADIEIDGNSVAAGSMIFAMLGSANHDPKHFGPNADELDLARSEAPHHLSFGGGIHHCLGAVLARMEGRIGIGSLVQRFPNMELTDKPAKWNQRLVLRGLDSLPVSI
ncbi:MAG: cytochrome P450 [Actinobacteria bacterium]|nr:cytochrome P450 [Acidimicrobiia bacterium]PHX59895.1 MAG: cytochrome P450 [Actinomycetota bacterium]